eukprot:TRINITY_DN8857_c0_g1_i3.p3 TRINITY_DN8857_c0_g1~~TRINITY_DN8857_c0_g1_i3.p3  ORF type:complete len:115 (-),score=33.33 TRINITY_DN8857_c0_g1_i3:51-395(-)
MVGKEEAIDGFQDSLLAMLPGQHWALRAVPPPPGGLPDSVALEQRLLLGAGVAGVGSDDAARAAAASRALDALSETGLGELHGKLLDNERIWLEHWQQQDQLFPKAAMVRDADS